VADEQARPTVEETLLEENRALWVEPGYLVLLRWRRPVGDEATVGQLEGSADAVRALLDARVGSVDDLHNIERLHPLEDAVRTLLRERVHPATVDILHLDHDCTVVCAALDPSRHYPEVIELDGDMPSPSWR
jgi:hypothetical protein